MSRLLTLVCCLILTACAASAQTDTELVPIEIGGGLFKSYKYKGTKIKNVKELQNIVGQLNDSEVNQSLSTAKTWNGVATATGFIGGALIGYPLGSTLAGKKFNVPIFAAGCGITTIGVLFAVQAEKHAYKSVTGFNKKVGGGAGTEIGLRFFQRGYLIEIMW